MRTKILLLGGSGQVGRALQSAWSERQDVYSPDRNVCNLGKIADLRSTIREVNPEIVVNAAAYTNVDKAETEQNLCSQINTEAPAVIAEEAKRTGKLFIHFSTAYVFDGRKGEAYVESDAPNALNVYGRSKLNGERAVMAAEGRSIVLRLNWVYSRFGRNFATDILRLASERPELSVVDDQIGAPTSAELVASVTSHLVDKLSVDSREDANLFGIYHLAPRGRVSRHGFAVDLVQRLRRRNPLVPLHEDRIVAVSSGHFSAPALRPANAEMNCRKICERFDVELPDWKASLDGLLEGLKGRGT